MLCIKRKSLAAAIAAILLTCATLFAFSAFAHPEQAQAKPYGPLEYKLDSNTRATITGYSSLEGGKPTSITIPAALEGRTEIVIQYGALRMNENLQTVTFEAGSTLADIPEICFYKCTNLETVKLPSSVKTISKLAFYGCSNLSSITLGDSLKSIGEQAFEACTSLQTINLPDSLSSFGTSAFRYCNSLTTCTVPSKVTALPDDAFKGCSELSTIKLQPGVKSIGVHAFENCKKLTSCEIPNSVTNIDEEAFRYSGITSITLPSGLQTLGKGAFEYSQLASINPLPASLTDIGAYAFGNCKFAYVALPDNLTAIPEGMFFACSSLESVHIPNSLKTIGRYAFDRCKLLDHLYIPQGVTQIGNFALRFAGKSGTGSTTYVYFANPNINWAGGLVFGESGQVSYPSLRIVMASTTPPSQCSAEASVLDAKLLTLQSTGVAAISYSPNGGSGSMESVDVPKNMGYALPISTFTYTSGTFSHWDVNGSELQPGQLAFPLNGVTAKACWGSWGADGYTIRFNANGGSGDMPDMFAKKGTAFTLPACTFTPPTHKTFQWWEVYMGGVYIPFSEGAMVDPGNVATCRVRACWVGQWTITFNSMGGTVSPATMKTNGQGMLASFPTATRAGYVLAGWSTTDDSGGIVTLGRVYTGDTTLHAIWEKASGYVISFDPNGGAITSGNTSIETDSSGKLTSPMPTAARPGYGFMGWFTLTDQQMTANDVFSSNMILYAQWSDRPVTSIAVSPASASVSPGKSVQLSTTVLPADAGNKALLWSTSDANVATVDSSGKVTGVAPGKATVTATAADGSGTTATCAVTVNEGLAPDGTALGTGADASAADAFLTSYAAEADPAGSSFAPLRFKLAKAAKKTLTLSWTKVKGTKKYVVYASICGKKHKLVKAFTLGASKKKCKLQKLLKGTYYKAIVVAIGANGKVISTSKMVHAATAGGKAGNYKSVTTKAKKGKLALKKGKSFKLRGKAVLASKKLKVKNHRAPAVLYESTNPKVAKVNKKGVVKAAKKGSCYVYAFTQTGTFTRIKVTVK